MTIQNNSTPETETFEISRVRTAPAVVGRVVERFYEGEPDYQVESAYNPFEVVAEDGQKFSAAVFDVKGDEGGQPITDRVIGITETRRGPGLMGWGIIVGPSAHGLSSTDHPIIGHIETIEGKQGTGLGLRRLRAMNALSKRIFGEPLSSDADVEELPVAMEGLWKKLVDQGEAVLAKTEDGPRYRFKRPPGPSSHR